VVGINGLFDTAVLVDLMRGYPPAVNWLASRGNEKYAITPYVWMEAINGVENKVLQARAEKRLQDYNLVYPTNSDIDWAMRQLAAYRLSRHVGVLDCLIAAPAHRLNLPLYTTNMKHFAPLLGELAKRPY
jgi:predicted nucleic acid-binding protein